jgi:3-oxoacyl-[acyl-carrier-protein] synthase-3
MIEILELGGVEISSVVASLPSGEVDNAQVLGQLCPEKAQSIIKATGISKRRVLSGESNLVDLMVSAAEEAIAVFGVSLNDIGAVVAVSFTSPSRMPSISSLVQAKLSLPNNVLAFDLSLACSGYVYGLYLSSLLVKQLGKRVLLLDGDVQSPFLKGDDFSTLAVLADGATATLIGPSESAVNWKFAFETHGEKSDALKCRDGTLTMNGFEVFKFVATDVVGFAKEFMRATSSEISAFVPHQANVYMVRELSKALGIDADKTWLSVDRIGNISSASIPATIAFTLAQSKTLPVQENVFLCGFGGGLSIGAALISLNGKLKSKVVEYEK